MNAPAPVIVHQPEKSRFICDTGVGEAEMTYRLMGTSVDFNHTYVPVAARGRGIAAVLVNTGLDWARSQGLSIKASCSYVRAHLRHA
ncbi:MAG TPA: GNAT family N-acetyltransferase [Dongiaceae bacterium]|nr:GNAT family N-acetyltransferase [Dongiaceae bacterium]